MGPKRSFWGRGVFAIIALLLLGWCIADVSAQTTTGKIMGRVIDAKTKEGLPGVSVAVVGMKTGAVTGADGEYAILGFSPGNYTVKVTIVGYSAQEIPVLVTMDRTTTLNVSMAVEAIQMGAVEVVGQRPVVEREISFTQQIMGTRLIRSVPTVSTRIQDVIRTQVGVDFDSFGLTIRGDDDQDIAYVQDGVRFNPRFYQTPFSSYAKSSTAEMQILTGGFAAEYGQARGGVVNIVSKDPKKWLVAADVRLSSPSNKHFGPNIYRDEYWQVRRYTSMDPTGDLDKDGLPDFEGWKAWLARKRKTGANSYNNQTVTTPEQARGIFLYQFRGVKSDGTVLFGDGSEPGLKDPQGLLNVDGEFLGWERAIDVTVGGPLIKDRVSFLYTYRNEKTPFAQFDWPPHFKTTLNQGKLIFTPTWNTKLTLIGLKSGSNAPGMIRTTGQQGNSFIKPTYFGGAFQTQQRPDRDFWAKGSGTESDYRDWQVGATWRHTLSARTFYEATFTVQKIERYAHNPGPFPQTVMDSRNVVAVHTDGHIELYPKLAQDGEVLMPRIIGNGTYRTDTPERQAWAAAQQAKGAVLLGNGPNGWANGAGAGTLRGIGPGGERSWLGQSGGRLTDSSRSSQADFSAALTTQLARRIEMKAGMSLQWLDGFHSSGSTEAQSYSFLAYRNHMSGTAFVQGKFEFNQLIVNAGGRMDFDRYAKHEDFHYWNPNDPRSDWFWKDPRQGGVDPQNFELEKTKATVRPPTKFYFSPRLGLSYPITVASKIYFNYGYFYRSPNMIEMYALYQAERAGTQPIYAGNPYAQALKQIQYEMGYEQGFFAHKSYAFKFAGDVYFKDSPRDAFVTFSSASFQPPPGKFAGWPPNEPYEQKDVRGLEAQLQKQSGRWWIGSIGYDFSILKTDRTYYSRISFDPKDDPLANAWVWSTTQINGSQVESVIDLRPIIRAHASFYSPAEWSKDPLKGNWELSFQYQWKRGAALNYNPKADPLLIGKLNQRWIPEKWLNMSLTKSFDLKGVRPQLYLDVDNLFDWKFPLLVGNSAMFTSHTDGLEGQGLGQLARYNRYMDEIIRRGMTPGEWIGKEGDPGFYEFMPMRYFTGYSDKRDIYFGVRMNW